MKVFFTQGSPSQQQQNEQDTKQMKIFKQLFGQSIKSQNIFEIQKEIMQLKIMMRLVLSVEQYAAIQLCGSKLPDIKSEDTSKNQELQQPIEDIKEKEIGLSDINKEESLYSGNIKTNNKIAMVVPIARVQEENKIKEQSEQIEKSLSHLEKIDLIDRDQVFFSDCVDRFFSQNSQSASSEIDSRILECMVGIDEDKQININEHP